MQVTPSDYPQLLELCHNRRTDIPLDGEEALCIYEREWRWVDIEKLTDRERDLIRRLVARYRPSGRMRRHPRPGDQPQQGRDHEAWLAEQVSRLRRMNEQQDPDLEGFDFARIADELESLAERDPVAARIMAAGIDSLIERREVYEKLSRK